MIQETEDDRLDQSLRDTFSDFDLPPSGHVWTGIEGRLSTLPGAPRPVPLLLVLPLVGLVGVAVGWLLPRPAAVSPAPRPATETAAKTRMASLQNQLPGSEGMGYVIPRPSTQALAFRHASTQVTNLVDKPTNQPTKVKRRTPASYSAPQTKLPASANTATPTDLLPVSAVSFIQEPTTVPTDSAGQAALPIVEIVALVVDPQPFDKAAVAAPAASHKAVAVLEPSLKGEGLRERRPEYRVPTHRLAERGRGLRRIQNNVVKHWHRLFGPRRARIATQANF